MDAPPASVLVGQPGGAIRQPTTSPCMTPPVIAVLALAAAAFVGAWILFDGSGDSEQ